MLPVNTNAERSLYFDVNHIEYHYEELDTNCINFISGYKVIFLSSSIYIEDQEILNKVYIESEGQENGLYGAIVKVVIRRNAIGITFNSAKKLMGKYEYVELRLGKDVNEKLGFYL